MDLELKDKVARINLDGGVRACFRLSLLSFG